MILLEFDLLQFFGRFHPLVVHLPIGFLIWGGILELLMRKGKVSSDSHKWVFFVGFLSALLAVAFGWMLAEQGGYEESALFWHRWLGVGVAVVSLVIWLIKTERVKSSPGILTGGMTLLMLLILVTGHYGGNLTHGGSYLWEHAPEPIAKLMGHAPSDPIVLVDHPDSVLVYAQLIQPIMDGKCVQCHNQEKAKGGLDLSTIEALQTGGDDGAVVVAGNASESELFKRITLPMEHKKFMPTDGNTPLDYHEVKLVEWWINSGAEIEQSVLQTGVTDEVGLILMERYALDPEPKPYVMQITVDPLAEADMSSLIDAGFKAQMLAADNNLLDVKLSTAKPQDLALLERAKEQVTWLNLSNSQVTDEYLAPLGQLANLTSLRLDNNPLGDEGVKALQGLQHLESLNLYATQVTPQVVETLKTLPALKRVYLWKTAISAEELTQLQEELDQVQLIGGSLSSVENTANN